MTRSAAEIVSSACDAAEWWSNRPLRERIDVWNRYRGQLVDRLDDLVSIVGRECDKPRLDVINEVLQAGNLIASLAKRAPKILRPRKVSSFPLIHCSARVEQRPLGVVLAITPWNYPIALTLGPVVQATIAGNAVVLKPSEYADETARFLHSIWESLSLPKPVWQLASGGPEIAQQLLAVGVDKIAFTGGAAGGKAVVKAAAETMTPVLLELGGSDAMIVAADADLERAANAAAWGAFLNAGQSCIAVRRCFVEKPIAEPFLARLKEVASTLSQGPAADGGANDHDIGCLRTERQIGHLDGLVSDAIDKGAIVVLGGRHDPTRGRYFAPTILTDVNADMRIMREELFGPLLVVHPVQDVEEGLRLANASQLGLGGSIWTRDRARGLELARRLRAGGVSINDCLVHFAVPALPFGGVKQSGFGRTHGAEGLMEYCSPQAILSRRFGMQKELQWFPYRGRHRLFRKITGFLHAGTWAKRLKSLLQR